MQRAGLAANRCIERYTAISDLTHIDENGRARMVDISGKAVTTRTARAEGMIALSPETLERISSGTVTKGDVFAAARIAGIIAAKRCDELIPLCHSIPLESVQVHFEQITDPSGIRITADVACEAKTGAEMEALVAVSVAALTIYDMVKAIDRIATIGGIRLLEKSGGASGHFRRS